MHVCVCVQYYAMLLTLFNRLSKPSKPTFVHMKFITTHVQGKKPQDNCRHNGWSDSEDSRAGCAGGCCHFLLYSLQSFVNELQLTKVEVYGMEYKIVKLLAVSENAPLRPYVRHLYETKYAIACSCPLNCMQCIYIIQK